MKQILTLYEAASGQDMNLPKFELYYSINIELPFEHAITTILGVHAVLGTRNYLGPPSVIDRSKKASFRILKYRVWHNINMWSSECLSKAYILVMIKFALQAISSYITSVFLLPITLIEGIGKMILAFWWGHGRTMNKGTHWLSWAMLTIHKNHRGMRFKDLTATWQCWVSKDESFRHYQIIFGLKTIQDMLFSLWWLSEFKA